MIVPVGCMNPPTFYVNLNKTVYLSLATVVSAYQVEYGYTAVSQLLFSFVARLFGKEVAERRLYYSMSPIIILEVVL